MVAGHQLLSLDVDEVQVLYEPSEFFSLLKRTLQTSKEEVILSALYVGIGPKEKELLSEVEKALSDASRPGLQITMLLDHSRSQRGPNSSLTLLGPLVEKYPARFRVYLYQVPTLRPWYMQFLPYQLREVLGVYHCKFCVADDKVILTGANLSEEYFSNRQDRYWVISELSSKLQNASISSFLRRFSSAVMLDSSKLMSATTLIPPEASALSRCTNQLEHLQDEYSIDQSYFEQQVASDKKSSMLCFPLIQNSSLSINGEENRVQSLFHVLSHSFNKVAVNIATPYTNFPLNFLKGMLSILQMGGSVDVVGPGASSHGFAKATGLKSYIPQLHDAALFSSIHEANSDLLMKESSVKEIDYFGYNRKNWTYHAKGLWFEAQNTSSGSHISGTYIGSSNFGIRSWSRDFELGFTIIGRSDTQKTLQFSDYQHLRRFCVGTERKINIHDPKNTSSLFIRLVSKLVKGFL